MTVRWLLSLCAALAAAGAFAAGEAPAEGTPRLSRVLPLLANTRDIDALRRELATLPRQGQPEERDAARQLVVRPFVADIAVVFVIDGSDPAPLVSAALLKDWGLDANALAERALANLRERFGTVPRKTVGKLPWLQVIDTADAYAASRLLLREPWQRVAAQSGGNLVAGVPSRDVVVFTTTADPARLDQLAGTVATVAERQPRAVSATLIEWTGDGWRPLRRDAPAVGQAPN